MNVVTSEKDSWSKPIIHNIYGLLALLGLFALIATGYRSWFYVEMQKLEAIGNGYHFKNYSNYLKATEALHRLESIFLYQPQSAHPLEGRSLTDHDINQNFHIARDHILNGLELEKKLNFSEFAIVANNLKVSFDRFEIIFTKRQLDNKEIESLYLEINNTVIALNQISKLHHIEYQLFSKKIDAFDKKHRAGFFGLLGALLLLAIYVTKRCFQAIEMVSKKQQETEDIIRRQAHYDYLTGLPNRLLALDRLNHSLAAAERNGSRVATLFIDLDDFKKINDTLGHDAGDKLLVEASRRLKCLVRGSDTVGRLGGDEFVIILDYLDDSSDAGHIAETLIKELKLPFNIDQREMLLSASVGISIYPDDGKTSAELLRNADSAMYHAKETGRSTYSFFTESMNEDVSRRLTIEEQLHNALDRNEFEVFYQPQIDLVTNKIMGAESLIRWNNSALGPIGPDEFIPVAEHNGLIVPIGQFVIEQALKSAAIWRENGEDYWVAVNLSPRQFRDTSLASIIEQTAQSCGVPTDRVDLEITEGLLMGRHVNIEELLDRLDLLGFNIVMDDFGTGYSSLSYLRNFPFDIIKIDRSFVSDITTSKSARELVNAAITMAHSLNLKVIAEGIETREQLEQLQAMKCDYAQGYYFGKPMPFDQICQLMAQAK